MIGEKFSYLTVLAQDETLKKKIYYRCQCECGAIKVVQKSNLLHGHTKSCGCMKSRMVKGTFFNVSPQFGAADCRRISLQARRS